MHKLFIILRDTFLLSSLLFLIGCTTARISIQTNPEGADVYARSIGSAQPILVGKTPLQMTNREIDKNFGGSGAMVFEVEKDGYKRDTVFVTELSKVDLNIVRDLEPKRDLEIQSWLNTHIFQMFEARRMVQAQRYDEALKILNELKRETPRVAAVHEMLGGVYLVKGNYGAALDSYRSALKFDSERTESAKMITYLEKTYGFSKKVEAYDLNKPFPAGERVPTASEGQPTEGSEKASDK